MDDFKTSIYGLGVENGLPVPYRIEFYISKSTIGKLNIKGVFSDDVLEVVSVALSALNKNDLLSDKSITIQFPNGISGQSCGLPILVGLYCLLNQKSIPSHVLCTGVISEDGYISCVEDFDIKMSQIRDDDFIIIPYENWMQYKKSPPPYIHPVKDFSQVFSLIQDDFSQYNPLKQYSLN